MIEQGSITTAGTIGNPQLVESVRMLREQAESVVSEADRILALTGASEADVTRVQLFHQYMGIFVIAFLATLVATPLMRRLAVANGIIDRPSESRKIHRIPIAYLGGIAVYIGLMLAILFSYTQPLHGLFSYHETEHFDYSLLSGGVPLTILLGMTIIVVLGLLDDLGHVYPRLKIAGQLIAAAALAYEDVGVKVAAGLLLPLARLVGVETVDLNGVETIAVVLPVIGPINIVYWTGTAIIAIFVLGGCNAANLIDGLDGLLTGVTAIAATGLLVIALTLAMLDDGPRDASRIVLCLALLGACLGFLPHNFNPANIFLGDAGSMLLGYCTVVIVLTLGDTGKTNLVLAGLVIYAIPIIDTTLAIFRRKIAGRSISEADDQHLHHMLKRSLGVKGAVFVLYAIGFGFALLGVILSMERSRVTYSIVIVFAAFIAVTALKLARREAIEQEALNGRTRQARRRQQPDDPTESRAEPRSDIDAPMKTAQRAHPKSDAARG